MPSIDLEVPTADTEITAGLHATNYQDIETLLNGGLDNSNISPTADLDATARVGVRKNSAGSTFERRRVNLIEGSGVTLTVADDAANEEVDVTVATTNPQTEVLISDIVLGSASATLADFTSIPGTYKHLRLVIDGRGDTAATSIAVQLRFNNDSGANYDLQQESTNAGTVSGSELLAQTNIGIAAFSAANATANQSGAAVITVPNYAATVFHKTAISQGMLKVGQATGNFYSQLRVGNWRSTAAITRITLLASAGNFIVGSRATLYGVN